jgi:hypothetical protein
MATLRTVGGSVGAAATTALFAALGGNAVAAFQPAYHVTLLAAAGVAAVIAILILGLSLGPNTVHTHQ